MRFNQFILSSEDCELLLELEKSGTIEKTAKAVAKDPSGISRQLNRIAGLYPAIEKRQGKWIVTNIGKRLNNYTRDAIQIQKQLIKNLAVLRIGTNREFGARVIGPHFADLQNLFPNTRLVIHTFEQGTEEALLNGKIDIGIDCERPNDPDISYKLILDEPIVSVCSKSFYKKHKTEIESKKIYSTPHLLCERLYPDKIFSKNSNQINIHAIFNDVATARAACLSGVGWGLFPRYAVENEIKDKKLVVIDEKNRGLSKYGVWSLRNRKSNSENADLVCSWLKKQSL